MPPTDAMTPERKLLAGLKALHEKATPGPWYGPHLSDDSTTCTCCSICDEGHEGGICTIHVDNEKRIADGGNGAPPLAEAKANGDLIRELHNAFPALAAELERAWASEAKLREELERARELLTAVVSAQWPWIEYSTPAREEWVTDEAFRDAMGKWEAAKSALEASEADAAKERG